MATKTAQHAAVVKIVWHFGGINRADSTACWVGRFERFRPFRLFGNFDWSAWCLKPRKDEPPEQLAEPINPCLSFLTAPKSLIKGKAQSNEAEN